LLKTNVAVRTTIGRLVQLHEPCQLG